MTSLIFNYLSVDVRYLYRLAEHGFVGVNPDVLAPELYERGKCCSVLSIQEINRNHADGRPSRINDRGARHAADKKFLGFEPQPVAATLYTAFKPTSFEREHPRKALAGRGIE